MSKLGYCEEECEDCGCITSHKINVINKTLLCLVCEKEQTYSIMEE